MKTTNKIELWEQLDGGSSTIPHAIAALLNVTPAENLDFNTPSECFFVDDHIIENPRMFLGFRGLPTFHHTIDGRWPRNGCRTSFWYVPFGIHQSPTLYFCNPYNAEFATNFIQRLHRIWTYIVHKKGFADIVAMYPETTALLVTEANKTVKYLKLHIMVASQNALPEAMSCFELCKSFLEKVKGVFGKSFVEG